MIKRSVNLACLCLRQSQQSHVNWNHQRPLHDSWSLPVMSQPSRDSQVLQTTALFLCSETATGTWHSINKYVVSNLYTPCPKKKSDTKLTAVTPSNLNGFSKFFYHRKEKEIFNKTHVSFPPHLKYVAALPWGIKKFKFVANLEENANKKCHINPTQLCK